MSELIVWVLVVILAVLVASLVTGCTRDRAQVETGDVSTRRWCAYLYLSPRLDGGWRVLECEFGTLDKAYVASSKK